MEPSFILLSCTIHKNQIVAEKISKLCGVEEAIPVFGTYDCVVKTEKMPSEDVQQMVAHQIRPLEDIHSVLTLYNTPHVIVNQNARL